MGEYVHSYWPISWCRGSAVYFQLFQELHRHGKRQDIRGVIMFEKKTAGAAYYDCKDFNILLG